MTTPNGTERRQTPTEFQRELMRAIVTKEPVGKSETVTIKTATTGSLAGQLYPDVQLSRDPDETMDQWRDRTALALREFLKVCLVYNDDNYRAELKVDALAEIRGGAS